MENRELLDAATRGEWTLEHDKKMLEIMQTIASKIEKRAVVSKELLNTMLLSLDQTRVRMSNLTRISDVKNAVYCENLITDDHHLLLSTDPPVPQKNSVTQSSQTAIENGLKLVENCFERHRVKLDPSNSRSEETVVYRPIDNFYSSLPYLIGSDKWKEKWHLGLMETEERQSQTGSAYAGSVDSSATPMKTESEKVSVVGVDLAASLESLPISTSSVGDQMVINRPAGLFDEPSVSSSYHPQPMSRNIVNFFEDEPPELPSHDPSPLTKRKPTNLFDDVDSVESLPIYESKINQEKNQQLPLPQQPVDLFNDNDFDSFIKKMEKKRNEVETAVVPNAVAAVKSQSREKVDAVVVVVEAKKKQEVSVQRDMKNIAEEISKKVQLKKSETPAEVISSKSEFVASNKTELPKSPPVVPLSAPKVEEKKEKDMKETRNEIKTIPKRIANLFDDDEDSEDFFSEILKQKSAAETPKPVKEFSTPAPILKKKISNLFDDDDPEGDTFDDIFKQKISTPRPTQTSSKILSEPSNKETNCDELRKSSLNESKLSPIRKQKASRKLFDDDDDEENDMFSSNIKPVSHVGQENKSKASAILTNTFENIASEKQIFSSAKSDVLSDENFTGNDNVVDNLKVEEIVIESSEVSSEILNIKTDNANLAKTNEQSKVEVINSEKSDLQANIEQEIQVEIDLKIPEKSEEFMEKVTEESQIEEVDPSQIVNSISNDNILVDQPNEFEPTNKDLFENIASLPPIIDDELDNVGTQHSLENDTIKSEQIVPKIVELSTKTFSAMPLFDDEPPDDDNEWVADDNNFDETENRPNDFRTPFSPSSNFSVPLFDEMPPDDDNDQDEMRKDPPPLPDFDDELSDLDEKQESKLEVPQVIERTDDDKQQLIEEKIKKVTDDLIKSTDQEIQLDENKIISDELPNTSIKSKLDIFSKSPEKVIASEPKKLPGKLNMNLNINVNALMPGARLPIKKVQVETEESPEIFEQSQTLEQEKEPSTLLNNDLAKSRAKISVKRRPSTRTGRRLNYEKSLQNIEPETFSQISTQEEIVTPTKSAPLNHEQKTIIDDEDDFLSMINSKTVIKEDKKIVDKPKTTTTSKISVFYDDEAETKQMLEEQKLEKQKSNLQNSKLFDELEEEDDNLFGSSSKRLVEYQPEIISNERQTNQIKTSSKQEQLSLFGDEEDDEDLFGTKISDKLKKVSKPLFNDADDDDLFVKPENKNSEKKLTIQKAPSQTNKKQQSLFGDESDDDDDLFSSKPKGAPIKSTASMSQSAMNKNSANASQAINDPLKDLF